MSSTSEAFLCLAAPVKVSILFKLLMKIDCLKGLTGIKDSECFRESMRKLPGVSNGYRDFV